MLTSALAGQKFYRSALLRSKRSTDANAVRAPAIANWMEMLARPGFSQRAVMRYRHRDGQYIWFEVEHSNVLNDPAVRLVRSEMVDVSERMDAIEQLRAGEQLLRRLTEAGSTRRPPSMRSWVPRRSRAPGRRFPETG
jgi:PAS domain-containing protein